KDIISAFLKGKISDKLKKNLSKYLNKMRSPIAVRSSSLLEDSQYQPLSGMYATYMLPNSNRSKNQRLEELIKSIKMVYASTYLKEPKSLIENSVHRHEEEKMAVIIMELIGKKHQDRYYPSASGLAQSYNYYPVSYMKRNEGVAYLALGLGRTIAEGEKSLRFSPKYPDILPQYFSIKSTIDNSQNQFYALDLDKGTTLLKGSNENTSLYSLKTAEKDGELKWAASVVSQSDNIVRHSLRYDGIRVITFPDILKWKKTGILEIIKNILRSGEQALGCPLEIEFAINFFDEKIDEFCLLQIKPMLITGMDMKKDLALKKNHQLICKSSLVLGNGLIENIQNIIYVDPKRFDTSKTQEIAKEIEAINAQMKRGQNYILIGPGRWGSADPWLGVPVEWDQISKAKVIIEYGMENFPVDPSFGSHFFQNVTSMRIGYFTLNHKNEDDGLNTKWIKSQPIKKKTDNLIWVESNDPIKVIINGQSGEGIITNKTMANEDIMDEHESSGI
ncbi:MAG: PEP/pyruvate-binding domain-containing protein, partial [Candidatus Neomarinimicrobiota bacterium]